MDPSEAYAPMALDKRAYRFFPRREEEKTIHEKKGTRYMFYGQVEHDDYEKRKIKEFYEYTSRKEKHYDQTYFHIQRVLLFLSGKKYKPKDTLKAMEEHITYRKEFIPKLLNLDGKVLALLQKGFFYPCGLDRSFRPLIVFNARLLDADDVETSFAALAHVHEEIIKKLFLPGQVECWNVIYDLGEMGLTDLPLSSFGKVLEKISLNYGGRLYRLWVVNAASSITVPWAIVKTFLDDITVEKIKIVKTNTDPSIFELYDESQVEAKFGGKQPNRRVFWPPVLPQPVVDEKRLLSDLDYEKLLQSGKLARNIVDPIFLEQKK